MPAFIDEYRALTSAELDDARVALLDRLDGDEADEADIERADDVTAVITERNERTEQANQRRQALSTLTPAVRRTPTTRRPEVLSGIIVQDGGDERSIAQRLMESGGFRQFVDANYHGRGGIEVDGFMQRAVITTADVKTIETVNLGLRPRQETQLGLLDLIGTSTMGSSALSYVTDTSADDDLNSPKNPVAEGAAKPEAALTFVPKTVGAETIAGWVAVTRQALEDESTLQGYISNRLTTKLRRALEQQVAAGTGVAPQLQGILPLAPSVGAGADAFSSIAAGMAAVEGAGFSVTGIALNPADWGQFMTDATSGTYGNQVNPFASPQRTLWGQTVVTSPYIPAGTALVGDFTEDTLFYRNNVQILVADQHADLFIKNTLIILAEARVVNAVFAAAAFANVSLPVVGP